MKCPKCGYLGFETVDRCRNCGYEFSLSSAPSLPDLSIRPSGRDVAGPLEDLALAAPDGRTAADAIRPGSSTSRAADLGGRGAELPLFGGSAQDDVPLIIRPSAPRLPLSVRRATPEVPRLRTEHRPSLLDQVQDGEDAPVLWRPPPAVVVAPVRQAQPATPVVLESAGLVARALAGAIDLGVLAAIDFVVIYFTLQINGLTLADLDLLPGAPLFAYLTIQDLGYFAAFTAGGQTLGKMVTGIQVVVDGSDRAPDLAHSLLRTVLWLLLAVPAGLGLASVLLDADKRGLHDRFARTRVVRATA